VRVLIRTGGEIWRGRVDFTTSVHCVDPVERQASKWPPSNLNTGVYAARVLPVN